MTANTLTKQIIKFVQLNGGQAERVNNIARKIGNRFVKSNMTKGTADIHCTIKGRSVKIEVKIGNDKQSDAQKLYQQSIESAGGIYYIAKDFDSFYVWYNKTFK